MTAREEIEELRELLAVVVKALDVPISRRYEDREAEFALLRARAVAVRGVLKAELIDHSGPGAASAVLRREIDRSPVVEAQTTVDGHQAPLDELGIGAGRPERTGD